MEIGDRVSSALDETYLSYTEFCQQLVIPPATFATWVRTQRGLSAYSLSTLSNYAESRQGLARMQARARVTSA